MGMQKYTGEWPDWIALTGEIIAQNAKECAWPYGTPKLKRTYEKGDIKKNPNPKQYGNYRKQLDKAFPKRIKEWGEQTACGASCDVFASTMVVSSGYDTKVPRGLGGAGKGQYKHFAESTKWKDVKAYKPSQMKPGDYILYLNKDAGGHACIYIGNGYTCEAGYSSKRYGCTVKTLTYDPNKKRILGIYRATRAYRTHLQKGDKGQQVKNMQLFLIWLGYKIEADGDFGSKTENAVINFQTKYKLTVDGKFGVVCLSKAQTISQYIETTFVGKLPTKTLSRELKSTGTQVKQLQDFLNWYSDYQLIRDGKFGPKTEEAVKDFQKQEGIKVDGIFGPKSLERAKKARR